MNVGVGHPFCKLEFATENGDINVTQKVQHDMNMDFDIYSVNTTRDVGGDDCATFTIVLVYKDKWYKGINGNDFVKISLGRGKQEEPVLFGMVDNIQKSMNYIDLKPVRTITITGRGFNKALMQFGIGAIHEIDAQYSFTGFYLGQDGAFFDKASPANTIGRVFEYYTKKGIDLSFANGKKWSDYINSIIIDDGSEISLANLQNYYSYQGGLWDYIKELRNAPFYETYWEVVNNKPTFIARPTPFNPTHWEKLNRVEVEDIDIIDEQLGKSDLETYTVFKVNAEHFLNTFENIFGTPIWYEPHYRKYGIRRLEINSKYIYENEQPDYTSNTEEGKARYNSESGDNEQLEYTQNDLALLREGNLKGQEVGDMFGKHLNAVDLTYGTDYDSNAEMIASNVSREINEEQLEFIENIHDLERSTSPNSGGVSQKTIDLFNWNIKNGYMANGTIMLKGNTLYKVGERLFVKSEGMEYYTENVSHNFIYNENWTTTLQVTRGLEPSERFSSPWNEYALMTPDDVAKISGIDPSTRKAAEQVANVSISGNTKPSGGGSGGGTRPTTPKAPSKKAQSVLDKARSLIGVTTYRGKCQQFVRLMYQEAGVYASSPHAKDAGNKWIQDTSRDNIPVGATVYFDSPYSPKYGHVGIYAGNGKMIDATNTTVKEHDIGNWWKHYRGWGYHGGKAI